MVLVPVLLTVCLSVLVLVFGFFAFGFKLGVLFFGYVIILALSVTFFLLLGSRRRNLLNVFLVLRKLSRADSHAFAGASSPPSGASIIVRATALCFLSLAISVQIIRIPAVSPLGTPILDLFFVAVIFAPILAPIMVAFFVFRDCQLRLVDFKNNTRKDPTEGVFGKLAILGFAVMTIRAAISWWPWFKAESHIVIAAFLSTLLLILPLYTGILSGVMIYHFLFHQKATASFITSARK